MSKKMVELYEAYLAADAAYSALYRQGVRDTRISVAEHDRTAAQDRMARQAAEDRMEQYGY